MDTNNARRVVALPQQAISRVAYAVAVAQGMIVDAHLDVAWAALADGRGFDAPPPGDAVVSRPRLARPGGGLIFPTLYSMPPSGLRQEPGAALSYRSPRA